jgi:HlyD family secretion protein
MRRAAQCFILLIMIVSLTACKNGRNGEYVSNGRIESEIIRLSAQLGGTVDSLFFREGEAVQKGQILAVINRDKLQAQLKQQQAQNEELDANLSSLTAQIRQLQSQLNFTQDTYEKTRTMVREGAATEQKRDELATQVEVLQAQMEALITNRRVIESRRRQLNATIELTQISLREAVITSPIDGIIVNCFIREKEWVMPGRVLFEVADLSVMEARIYLPLSDLNRLQLGQEVQVWMDGYEKALPGKVKWIASEAEFTPKTILTKETRTTLVYGVKVQVPNPEGRLKIGMPVEVRF